MTAPLFAADSAPASSPSDGALAVAEHRFTTICAWCGAYLSGPDVTVTDGIEYEVSHGICGPCAARMSLPCDDCRAATPWDRLVSTVGGAVMVCETCADRRGRDALDGRASD